MTAVYGYDVEGHPRVPNEIRIHDYMHEDNDFKMRHRPRDFPRTPSVPVPRDIFTGPLVFYPTDFSR